MKTRLLAFPLLVFGAVVLTAACSVSAGFTPILCSDVGTACGADSDCCSFFCNAGVCDAPTTACTLDNDPCVADSDCCSAICASDGYCGLPGGGGVCAADGEACSVDSDCCDTTEFCDDVGSVCTPCLSTTSVCNTDADCCSGVCDPNSGTCA